MIILSENLVLSEVLEPGTNPDNPIIAWHNLVTIANLSATGSHEGHPVTNMANSATNLRWQAPEIEYHGFEASVAATEPIDYIAFAGHNFASGAVRIQILGSVDWGGEWLTLVADHYVDSDGPLIYRIEPRPYTNIWFDLTPEGDEPVRIAVLRIGKLLTLPHRLYVGHTPTPMGRRVDRVPAQSISGQYLGSIITGSETRGGIALQNLKPAWYRENFEPFLRHAETEPFFFAWRPHTYPNEVGYLWLTNDPIPVNQRPNGMMQVSLEYAGVVR